MSNAERLRLLHALCQARADGTLDGMTFRAAYALVVADVPLPPRVRAWLDTLG